MLIVYRCILIALLWAFIFWPMGLVHACVNARTSLSWSFFSFAMVPACGFSGCYISVDLANLAAREPDTHHDLDCVF